MPRVADFVQFSDVAFHLQNGGDFDRLLTQTITEGPAIGEAALLIWNVRCEGLGSVTYEVNINDVGNATKTYIVSQEDWSAVQGVVPANAVRQGSNTVTFAVTDGASTLSISDVVLWYHQDI